MVDLQTVCCMCGDIGFPDKLFRCNKCRHRFQHSYCSNYYSEFAEPVERCDWCQSEERNSRQGSSSKKSSAGIMNRSQYSGDKIKQESGGAGDQKGKSSGTPSPRPTTRSNLLKRLPRIECTINGCLLAKEFIVHGHIAKAAKPSIGRPSIIMGISPPFFSNERIAKTPFRDEEKLMVIGKSFTWSGTRLANRDTKRTLRV
ncbi:hypothetical protein V6N11_012397 [Hibiscus sabdariffa]|uniref:PHD-type zinc finger plants domain-containing protein n=1 Tax=Hibiscus sabdariffa TaxID=183260 RepID=A0ABR2QBE8_9ROSI